MADPVGGAVGDRPLGPEGGPAAPDGVDHGVGPDNIEEGILLAGEAGEGQILGRGGGPNRDGGLLVRDVAQPGVGPADGGLHLGRDRRGPRSVPCALPRRLAVPSRRALSGVGPAAAAVELRRQAPPAPAGAAPRRPPWSGRTRRDGEAGGQSLPRFSALPPTSGSGAEPARRGPARGAQPGGHPPQSLAGGIRFAASISGSAAWSAAPAVSSHITSRLRNTGGPSHRAAIFAAKSEVSGRLEFSIADS